MTQPWKQRKLLLVLLGGVTLSGDLTLQMVSILLNLDTSWPMLLLSLSLKLLALLLCFQKNFGVNYGRLRCLRRWSNLCGSYVTMACLSRRIYVVRRLAHAPSVQCAWMRRKQLSMIFCSVIGSPQFGLQLISPLSLWLWMSPPSQAGCCLFFVQRILNWSLMTVNWCGYSWLYGTFG